MNSTAVLLYLLDLYRYSNSNMDIESVKAGILERLGAGVNSDLVAEHLDKCFSAQAISKEDKNIAATG